MTTALAQPHVSDGRCLALGWQCNWTSAKSTTIKMREGMREKWAAHSTSMVVIHWGSTQQNGWKKRARELQLPNDHTIGPPFRCHFIYCEYWIPYLQNIRWYTATAIDQVHTWLIVMKAPKKLHISAIHSYIECSEPRRSQLSDSIIIYFESALELLLCELNFYSRYKKHRQKLISILNKSS